MFNIHITAVPAKEEKKIGEEKNCIDNFQKLSQTNEILKLTYSGAWWISNKVNLMKIMPKHIISKFLKSKYKENNMKIARG